MKFIITGTSGYIGSKLCKYLKSKGHSIFEINRAKNEEGSKIYSVESLAEIISNEKPDIIIHLAALFLVDHKSQDIDKLLEANIKIGVNLLEAMSLTKFKNIITTGTSWEYYNSDDYLPVNLYAATKHAFHIIAKYYHEAHDINLIDLILYDTYGELDTRKKLIPFLMKSIHENSDLNMSIGRQKIYLTHINDVCSAFEVAAKSLVLEGNKRFIRHSIRPQSPIEIKEVVKIITQFNSNFSANIIFGAIKERVREIFDPKIRNDILPGWNQEITLIKGLKMTYENYEK